MQALNSASHLANEGRFADALRVLVVAPVDRNERLHADVLRAELLERTGRVGQSRALLQDLLKSKDLAPSDQSRCEFALERIDFNDGNLAAALLHLQRSIAIATQAGNLDQLCWSQIRLLFHISSRCGPAATAPLIAEIRANAIKLGNPQVIAALHIHIGLMEARRALFQNAQQHTRLGQRLLMSAPNVWLDAMAENSLLNIAMLECDIDRALGHGLRALRLSEESGVAGSQRASLSNVGNVLHWLGRFDEAVQHFERAFGALPSSGEEGHATFDGLAQVHLSQNRFDDCNRLLDRVEQSIGDPNNRALYTYRYIAFTRVRLLVRLGRWTDALARVESLLPVAADAADHLLCSLMLLVKAELLQCLDRMPEFLRAVDGITTRCSNHPDMYAQYERLLGCALVATGRAEASEAHFERARRIYEGLRHVPGLMDVSRSRGVVAVQTEDGLSSRTYRRVATDNAARAKSVLQSASALIVLARHPELLGRELVQLLADADCVKSATAASRAATGVTEVLVTTGDAANESTSQSNQRIVIGVAGERTVELIVEPKSDIESVATLNAVMLLLATVHDLERARAEREERLTLWPLEDVPLDSGQAVVTGQMRELMTFARRIATTNVSVLVTGESGTGKEILARAIHTFSDRASRPFIPFNCTAVPREMLESHLFGHRRGAFTGADRDHPGLIRAARDGTLFLDEIGELGLDLQPKLLRFLESGEICPLGEPAPFTVKVRIVAATNSNLEALVQEGRFREDLFYRLNVIRLRIPPLRERRDEIPGLVHHFVGRAAEEFKKGQVRVAEETMEHLLLYRWPGNVRQLHNELRRMVALTERDAVLSPADLSAEIASTRVAERAPVNGTELLVPLRDKLLPTLSRIEREMIRAALRDHHGKVDAAARALGISRKGLYLKRQRLGL